MANEFLDDMSKIIPDMYFVLDADHAVVAVSSAAWIQARADGGTRRVDQSSYLVVAEKDPESGIFITHKETQNIMVSTVFTGIGDRQRLFETMVFGGVMDEYAVNAPTWELAMENHQAACALVKEHIII